MSPKKAELVERAEQAKADGSTVGRGKKSDRPFITGHCSSATMVSDGLINSDTPAREWHAFCRGTLLNGNGTIKVCSCDCHSNHTVCRDCGRIDVELVTDPELKAFGCCLDRDGCASELARRLKESPIHQFLTEHQKEQASKRAREVVRGGEGAGSGPTPRGGTVGAEKAPRSRTKGQPQRCHCGCGAMTKGGQFAMGHDMKLKGRLFEQARGTTGGPAIQAATEVILRGWNEAGIRDEVRAEAREGIAAGLATLEHFVNKRYDGG